MSDRMTYFTLAMALVAGSALQAQTALPIPGPYQVAPAPLHAPASQAPQARMQVPYWMTPAPAAPVAGEAPEFVNPQQAQRWQLRFVPGWGWVPQDPTQMQQAPVQAPMPGYGPYQPAPWQAGPVQPWMGNGFAPFGWQGQR